MRQFARFLKVYVVAPRSPRIDMIEFEITMGYRGDEEDDRRRCARCDAIVWAEPKGSCHTNASTECALCDIAMPGLPFVDSDYFNVVMRVGRPLGPVARFRRANCRL